MNVLIVEDNEAAADLLQELLVLGGHRARCSYTGQAALQAAAGEDFDVVLLDLNLPDLPGTEVAQRLRANTARPRPVIVATSGFSQQDAGAGAAGLFDHHLQKPIDFDALDRILAAKPAAGGG